MRRIGPSLLFVLSLAASPVYAQTRPISVELFGAYTTSSKLFPNANDPSEVRRAFFLSLDHIFHAGVEVRTSISALDLQLGISTEFVQETQTIEVPVASATIPVRDGFRAFPIELTGYFYLPIGSDRFRIYLGGGIGLYTGERIYEYASARSNVVDRSGGFGIHVLCGGEYSLAEHWALRTEIKVRDLQFESVNKFSQATVVYEGHVIPLPQETMSSRFNVDGFTLRTGIAYYF